MIDHPRSLIECLNCGAAWQGSEGDDCYWCDKRYRLRAESERQRLLWPEWMDWGERYVACNDIDRSVWAETRGFVGDYQGKWKRDLIRAVPESLSNGEAIEALKRYDKWMTHTKR